MRASRAEQVMDYMKWIAATLSAFLQAVPALTWFLVALMALDAFFAIGVWVKRRRFPTYEEVWEVTGKKAYHLAIVLVAGLFDHYVGIPGVSFVQATTIFLAGPELWGILKKAAILEVPVPPQFAKVLALFGEDKNANQPLP